MNGYIMHLVGIKLFFQTEIVQTGEVLFNLQNPASIDLNYPLK